MRRHSRRPFTHQTFHGQTMTLSIFRRQCWPMVFVASSSQSRSASITISSTALKNFTAFGLSLPNGRSFPLHDRG
jgi:hypothetical protein